MLDQGTPQPEYILQHTRIELTSRLGTGKIGIELRE